VWSFRHRQPESEPAMESSDCSFHSLPDEIPDLFVENRMTRAGHAC
jgi:hypothetical protein